MLWYFAAMLQRTKLKIFGLVLITLISGQMIPHVRAQGQSFEPKAFHFPQRTAQGYLPIISDLNGDKRLDQVQIFSSANRAFIHITFARGKSKQLSIEVPSGIPGSLYADDIDHDNLLVSCLDGAKQTRSGSDLAWRRTRQFHQRRGRKSIQIKADTSVYRPLHSWGIWRSDSQNTWMRFNDTLQPVRS